MPEGSPRSRGGLSILARGRASGEQAVARDGDVRGRSNLWRGGSTEADVVQLSAVKGLRCVRCSHLAALTPASYTCAHCGGNLDVEYDYAQIQSSWDRASLAGCGDRSLWRYLPLFPVKTRVDGPPVGWTPLIPARGLGACLGAPRLYVKDESRNPTGSLKDRASALVLARAGEARAEF